MADYAYWQNALRGEFGPVHEGDAQLGFWRKRTSRAGPFVPVAIWEAEGGKLVAVVDGREGDPGELWSYVCRYPVSEADYRSRVATGKWGDEDENVTASLAAPGHNQGPTDEAEILASQIEAAAAGAGQYAEVRDDETASKAQSLRARLLELSGEAEKKHKVEKAPSLDEGRRIDKRWFPLRDTAKAAADAIRAALSAHETRKAREAAERARVAEEARIKAEREAAKAAARGRPAPPMAPPAPEPEPVQTQVRGAYGKAATIKAVKVARVTDQAALYPFLSTHKELVDLMARLAQRAVDAGLSPPGVEITEERKVV